MDRQAAERIVDSILLDLTDRRGLKQEFESIDLDTQLEIRERWIGIAMVGGDGSQPHWVGATGGET